MQELLVSIGQELLKVVLPILVTAVAGALATWLVQLARKAHLDVTAERQAKWESLIRRGLQWAEEYIEAKVKAGVVANTRSVTGPLKQAAAVEYVQGEAPNVPTTKIVRDIGAKLAESPWGASSFPAAVPAAGAEAAR